MNSGKIALWFSENKGGGDQRSFVTFPKIHPFWWWEASLSTQEEEIEAQQIHYWGQIMFKVIWNVNVRSCIDNHWSMETRISSLWVQPYNTNAKWCNLFGSMKGSWNNSLYSKKPLLVLLVAVENVEHS